jgi:CubicO group peptidase (beta-lactamase class C family)
MKKTGLLLFALCCGWAAISQTSPSRTIPQKLDTLLAAFEKQKLFNGSVLVSRKGAIVLQRGDGYKDLSANTRDDENTIYQIGSVTKQFTSAIILRLQEKGKLTVQDKLSKYIPDYPHGDSITIENLLTHVSGIYNYTNDGFFMAMSTAKPIARDSLIARFKYKPLDFRPGSTFSYSNSGYILLGYIIEKVTGKPYFQVVREDIFQPLQMGHSGFDFAGLKSPDKATGYLSPAASQGASVVDSSVSFSAGALYSTVGDLYKWDRALYGNKIMSQASLQQAFTPHKSNYGYGWVSDSAFGKKVVEHGGAITGFTSYILRVPEDSTCIILLDNRQSTALDKMAATINALLHDGKYELPRERIEITMDTAILRQYTGDYQLAPNFVITISLENGRLRAQPSGQGKAELFAEKENFFFLKVVDAQVEFIRGADGKVEKMVLHQGGRELPGNKIR